jgi:NitT/TauT family transport system permease protein
MTMRSRLEIPPQAPVVLMPAVTPPSRWRSVLRFAPPILGLALVLALWEGIVRFFEIPRYLVPKPTDIVDAAFDNRSQLLEATGRTMVASLTGLCLAIVLGIAGAVILGFSRFLERSFFPYAIVLQTTPIVAIAPMIVIWIGPGLKAIIMVSLIISFFPMLSNTLAGLNSVDPEARSLFRLYGASRWKTMWKLRLPGAMPYIMAGVTISGGLSVIGAIVGEFVAGIGGGRGGLGFVVQVSSKQLNVPYLAAGAMAGAIMGVLYHVTSKRLARRLLAWHESALSQEGGARRISAGPASRG